MYFQGIPGPPGQLGFSEITMNTLKVSWEEPERPNGEILGYIVAYETAEQDESECDSFGAHKQNNNNNNNNVTACNAMSDGSSSRTVGNLL